ncbi:MAG: ankyrin repeat domain-containing protein [Gemmatimonadota bacterium]|nr:ankyrin repeat domain-containing protein [Gemmatimonadota bacterium]
MSKLQVTSCKAEITCARSPPSPIRLFIPATALVLLCPAPASGQPKCEDWGARHFFIRASAERVAQCLGGGARDDDGATVLHVAAGWTNEAAVIDLLVEAGEDINARDANGRTPLHSAAATSRRPEVVAALIAAGADPNARDAAGNTPLHASSSSEIPGVVLKLLELGADPTARNDKGRIADPADCENWSTRAFAGVADAETAAECAESGWDVNVRNADGDSPLHQAVRAMDTVMIASLLEIGADPDAANDEGATPLEIALTENPAGGKFVQGAVSDSGAVENPDTAPRRYVVTDPAATIVALLLDAGADPSVRDRFSGRTPFHWASSRMDSEAIALLARAGADPNALDARGRTPLHEAAATFGHNPSVIGVLVDAGADIDARDRSGRTPLHAAAARGWKPETVVALVAAGADLTAVDFEGNTPLHASWSNDPAVITTLLQLGADPMARNNAGQPADPTNCENASTEGFARAADDDDVARCFESGAGVNARDSDGSTPLHHAVGNGDLAMVVRLLDAGADVNAGDWGRTPLHRAAERGDTAIVRVLAEAGANPDARNDRGETPCTMHHATAATARRLSARSRKRARIRMRGTTIGGHRCTPPDGIVTPL